MLLILRAYHTLQLTSAYFLSQCFEIINLLRLGALFTCGSLATVYAALGYTRRNQQQGSEIPLQLN